MKKYIYIVSILVIITVSVGVIYIKQEKDTIYTSGQAVEYSNQKIEWGIKRNDNHEQPDLGSKNKELLDKYEGIAMGNEEEKYVYLTFDEGYEAGYTDKILQTLKENNVTATFFITAHYVNTQEDLVRQMIEDGHIVGNQLPPS